MPMSVFTPEQEARIREIAVAAAQVRPDTPETRDAFLRGLGLSREERRQELLQCFPDQADVIDQLTPARNGASADELPFLAQTAQAFTNAGEQHSRSSWVYGVIDRMLWRLPFDVPEALAGALILTFAMIGVITFGLAMAVAIASAACAA